MKRNPAPLLLSLVVSSLSTATVLANVPLQGAVAGVTPANATALGGTVCCRQYSVSGTDAGVNQNQCYIGNTACCSNPADPTHNLDRCGRPYNSNFGGYSCNSEATAAYNNDGDNQVFYNLIEGEVNAGTGDHIGFFAVQGQIASSTTPTNTGDARFPACGGAAAALNCFNRADQSNSRPTPVLSTRGTWGPVANQIASIGGLSPVMPVRVTRPGSSGCAAAETRLTWEDPHLYPATMKNGVATPVIGVNLYRNDATCNAPPDGTTGWNLVGSFPLGGGATGICVPIATQAWFATTTRVKGPGTGPLEIESYKSANSQCVGDPTAMRIVSVSARYAGRNTVNVSFTSGTEGGVQGYFVSRASAPTGPYAHVSEMIGATGDDSRYVFADHVRTSGGGFVYYQIEVVKSDGTVEHSAPASVVLPAPKGKKLGRD